LIIGKSVLKLILPLKKLDQLVTIVNVTSPLQIGLSGISRGLENLQEISTDIAQVGLSEDLNTTTDLTQSVVDLKEQELATLASIKVVETAEEVLGTLLDVVA